MSHPLRVRGLKPKCVEEAENKIMSHPLRVRGLKHPNLLSYNTSFSVASFTGAWVETVILIMVCNHILSHPLRVRGLKHKS